MQKTGTFDGMPGSELRHDPVQRRWVIVASERGRRPVEFSRASSVREGGVGRCPFCVGNEGLTPKEIARYGSGPGGDWKVRVVPNKFPALRVEGELRRSAAGQYDRMSGVGAHEVIIETPDHGREMADLPVEHLALVLRAYRDRIVDLRNDTRLKYILVFKNSGLDAGASLPHAHSQVMATPVTPRTVVMELVAAREHYRLKERCIFCDIMEAEHEAGSRVVLMDAHFTTHCPYASRFPFEMVVYPRRHMADYVRCDDELLMHLARHLKEVLRRMNKALNNPGFNMVLHTAPSVNGAPLRSSYWDTLEADWHWHFEILPRISNVAGFEWGTGFYINPTPPEDAAAFMRQVDL